MTTPRIDIRKYLNSPVGQAMLNLSKVSEESGLERSLLDLVKVRGSQINGCAYCLDMHTKDARAAGETEQRLYGLSAWRETPYYSEKERAALEWTEAITLLSETHAPDDVYERVRQHFDEQQFVALTLAATVINTWNRLVLSFRVPAGTYQPQSMHA